MQFTYNMCLSGASAVQKKVKELQERVSHLMIVIVDHVIVKYEEGSEMKALECIGKDIEELLRCVDSGPDIFSDNPEDSMNRSIGLSVESKLVEWNPNP